MIIEGKCAESTLLAQLITTCNRKKIHISKCEALLKNAVGDFQGHVLHWFLGHFLRKFFHYTRIFLNQNLPTLTIKRFIHKLINFIYWMLPVNQKYLYMTAVREIYLRVNGNHFLVAVSGETRVWDTIGDLMASGF